MKYFVTVSEREGTCYHEFYRGKWDGITFWKEDSLLLHDDVLLANKGFADAVAQAVPIDDPFAETEISAMDWRNIGDMTKYNRA